MDVHLYLYLVVYNQVHKINVLFQKQLLFLMLIFFLLNFYNQIQYVLFVLDDLILPMNIIILHFANFDILNILLKIPDFLVTNINNISARMDKYKNTQLYEYHPWCFVLMDVILMMECYFLYVLY